MGDRACMLTTSQLADLNTACTPLAEAFGFGTYLVGSALTDPDFRDVDVRLILDDEEFDRRFGDSEFVWGVMCRGIAALLVKMTGLPIDFQIQRQTEANEKFPGPGNRNALGGRARLFAGGGDATRFHHATASEETPDA